MLINEAKITNQTISCLVADLGKFLANNRKDLFYLNHKITQDTAYWIKKDYSSIQAYLKNYLRNNRAVLKKRLKPKGRTLIMLSYNEPFALSIIPVLNALIAGNEVILKPSKKNKEFVNKIWIDSGIAEKYRLKLDILQNFNYDDLDKQVKKTQAVYFFGGYEKAKLIGQVCARHFVEFVPEIEAGDCKIIKKTKPVKSINWANDVQSTLDQAFAHAGQSCHRIHGLFINRGIYQEYFEVLTKVYKKCIKKGSFAKQIDKKMVFSNELLSSARSQISAAKADEVMSARNDQPPYLVINPSPTSDFALNAFFLPTLWIIPFDSDSQLLGYLNKRKFHLGLNIVADDDLFIKKIVAETNFSRYTINTEHIEIKSSEGWGGNWPTGYSGYQDWLYHFTNPYVVIE